MPFNHCMFNTDSVITHISVQIIFRLITVGDKSNDYVK